MLCASFTSRSNITEPVLGEEYQCARHRGFLCYRGNSHFCLLPLYSNEVSMPTVGRIVVVLRETADRSEVEAAENLQGGADYRTSGPS